MRSTMSLRLMQRLARPTRCHVWKRLQSTDTSSFPPDIEYWSQPPSTASVSDVEINRLAQIPRQPLTLADLAKYDRKHVQVGLQLTMTQAWPSTLVRRGIDLLGQFHAVPSACTFGASHPSIATPALHRCVQPCSPPDI